ncbi:response regulator [Noviherbaspirillum malthae]|uniref:response regulator n=1 Tax=Noviherbaspirillum malthae TaxID=1260987 RepID=UPI00188FC171|nr:response regulator [Noviherbaspirillum malthae]
MVSNVLVVEDDEAARQLTCEMLSVLGLEARGVATAEEAVELLRRDKFVFLVADIALPAMTGIELATLAVDIQPNIRIIFASGNGYLISNRLDYEFILLPKPYNLVQLKLALEEYPQWNTLHQPQPSAIQVARSPLRR